MIFERPAVWTKAKIDELFKLLDRAVQGLPEPMSIRIAKEYHKDPYLILISCLLSLRARDVVTYPVSKKLFERAKTPQEMCSLPLPELETIIHSIGTYRRKARVLKEVSADLIKRFGGKVPSGEADLLSLPGVGRKTANLVRSVAFDIPAICVDVHVHRIANQLGLVHAKTPEETEFALQKLLPREYWSDINRYFVLWGQFGCKKTPCKPSCPFRELCRLLRA
jgi:endonuclease-3